MRKISKSDLPINRNEHAEHAEREANRVRSKHFAVGEFIIMAGKGRGEILSTFSCKCPRSERGIRVKWEDGTVENLWPFALNRKPLTHR
jgi:hypothetical protein